MLYTKEIKPLFRHDIIHIICENIDRTNDMEYKTMAKDDLLFYMKASCKLDGRQQEAYTKVLNDL